MSELTYCTTFKGRDIEIVYEFDGSYGGVQDGDFDLYVTEVYLDVDQTSKQGKNLFDDYDDSELDKMGELICENENLSGMAYESACDRADWSRDQRKDNQLMGD